jgi:hypothetical protein
MLIRLLEKEKNKSLIKKLAGGGLSEVRKTIFSN